VQANAFCLSPKKKISVYILINSCCKITMSVASFLNGSSYSTRGLCSLVMVALLSGGSLHIYNVIHSIDECVRWSIRLDDCEIRCNAGVNCVTHEEEGRIQLYVRRYIICDK